MSRKVKEVNIKGLLRKCYESSPADRKLESIMPEVMRLSDVIDISTSARETAETIVKGFLEKNLDHGRSYEPLPAVAVYGACRMTESPITLKDVEKNSLVDKADIAHYYNLLIKKGVIDVPVVEPEIYVSKIGERARISEKSQTDALLILKEARKKRLTSGKNPSILGASALYLACLVNNERKTQSQLADAANTTPTAIARGYKNLRNALI